MKKLHQEIIGFVIGGVIGSVILAGVLLGMSSSKIMPGVMIAGIEVGGMEVGELRMSLESAANDYSPMLSYGEARLELPSEIVSFDIEETVNQAVRTGRNGWRDLLHVLRDGESLEMRMEINEKNLSKYTEELREMVNISGVPNSLELVRNEIVIKNGEDGVELDEDQLRESLSGHAKLLVNDPITIQINETRNMLTEKEKIELKEIVEKLVGDNMIIKIDEEKAVLKDDELVSFVSSFPENIGLVRAEVIKNYVLGLSKRYDREPQDAAFQFVDGSVEEFSPALDGIEIMIQSAVVSMRVGVERLLENDAEIVEVEIPIERTSPKITTKEVNNLGIVERIGRGESYYAHSIINRVYNVGLASKRINGALIAPGEEFSFNNQVGEISGSTGYKTAYVISGGRTILGDGGGVCQVSTTVFRAALSSGLPITERWAHAYRVGYYEQNSKPGFDATIYSPSKDLRFLNDTPGHILIQTIIDEPGRHLIIDIYGTADGRISLISPARVWGVTPPPPDLYQDDPSLSVGVVRQVDWAAWGAKTAFDYRVERDGETITSETYASNFRPWQNVFLKGTGE